MTENKRYSFNWERGHPNFWDNHCDLADSYLTCGDVVNILNELNDENEQLKQQIEDCKDVNVRCCNDYSAMRRDVWKYKKENEQLKQFKEKVFTWIDREIARNEEAIEWGKESGGDSGSIGFYNHMLKKLQKELQE